MISIALDGFPVGVTDGLQAVVRVVLVEGHDAVLTGGGGDAVVGVPRVGHRRHARKQSLAHVLVGRLHRRIVRGVHRLVGFQSLQAGLERGAGLQLAVHVVA